jgi:predicted nucleotidyltransferase component of viral defense system
MEEQRKPHKFFHLSEKHDFLEDCVFSGKNKLFFRKLVFSENLDFSAPQTITQALQAKIAGFRSQKKIKTMEKRRKLHTNAISRFFWKP